MENSKYVLLVKILFIDIKIVSFSFELYFFRIYYTIVITTEKMR